MDVYHGDLITVLESAKTKRMIRLAGIDAPKLKQDFGERSTQALSSEVFGKPATIEAKGS